MIAQLKFMSASAVYFTVAGVTMAAHATDQAAGVRSSVIGAPGISAKVVVPGALKGFSAAVNEVDAGKPLLFSFAGTGHCKLTVAGGDGSTADFSGELPFAGNYIFGTGAMSSFEAFKNYSATVTAHGQCKTAGNLKPVGIKVINPKPQGAGPVGSASALLSGQPGKVMTPGKPGDAPAIPSQLTGLTLSGKTITGAPAGALAVGAPTLLSVAGTGNCKFHLSYVNLDAQGNTIANQYPVVPKASSVQSPFPMSLQMIAATPAGVYKWSAVGTEGCTGNASVTLAVQ